MYREREIHMRKGRIHICIYIYTHMYSCIDVYMPSVVDGRGRASSLDAKRNTPASNGSFNIQSMALRVVFLRVHSAFKAWLKFKWFATWVRLQVRSTSEISSCFLGPRPWHIEIRHRVKKHSQLICSDLRLSN